MNAVTEGRKLLFLHPKHFEIKRWQTVGLEPPKTKSRRWFFACTLGVVGDAVFRFANQRQPSTGVPFARYSDDSHRNTRGEIIAEPLRIEMSRQSQVSV